jgi:hypothetical protein
MRLRMGHRYDLKNMANGKTHLAIQRDPRVPHFIWWCDKYTDFEMADH